METFHIRPLDEADHARRRDALIARVRRAAPFADVREVGSTAIPGAIGKGDLDVLARCDADRFAALCDALDRVLSFDPDQLHDASYRGYVGSVDGVEAGSVQATITGCAYDTFTAFHERLLAEPALVEAYNRLKRAWDGRPMDGYRVAKAAFIERVLAGPEVPQPVPWAWLFDRRTPTFTQDTVPAGLLRDHTTKPDVWGRIVVEQGELEYHVDGRGWRLVPGVVGGVPPGVPHAVRPVGDVSFYVEFLRR